MLRSSSQASFDGNGMQDPCKETQRGLLAVVYGGDQRIEVGFIDFGSCGDDGLKVGTLRAVVNCGKGLRLKSRAAL